MLAAGESLRAAYPVLRRLSARHLRAICRQWYRAGWSPARIVHALDNAPDGTAHACDTEVRHLARWMMARLDLWRDPATGQPLPPPAVVRDRPAPPRTPRAEATAPDSDPAGPAAAGASARGAALARQYAAASGGQFAAALQRREARKQAAAARSTSSTPPPAGGGR